MLDLAAALRSPDLFAHSYEPVRDAVLLLQLSRDDYEHASFLDQRVLTPQARAEWVPFTTVETAVAERPDCARFIFHVGHVGSTLVARLLGAHRDVLALREPAALRTLAQLQADVAAPESTISTTDLTRRIAIFTRLYGRTYEPAEIAVVKATSFASELASQLLAREGTLPAIAITVAPDIYIAGIMAGENSRLELRTMAQPRLRRLHARLGESVWRLTDLSEGERAAMSWLCEMLAIAAGKPSPGQLLWVDFEKFLIEPAAGVVAALKHLGVVPDPSAVEAAIRGPIMRQYSKAPEHSYTPALRAQVIQQARREHGAQVARGMRWLEGAMRRFPQVAHIITS
jgi:hypothetical protein